MSDKRDPHVVWCAALAREWQRTGTLTGVGGEWDLNFLLSGADPAVLKVMRPGCDRAFVEMQVAVLAHLADRAPDLPLPLVIPSRSGESIVEVEAGNGETRLLWLLTKLPGTVYASTQPRPPVLLREIGQTLGRMHNALADFRHDLLARELKWDLRKSEWIEPHLDLIEDRTRRWIVETALESFKAIRDPLFGKLPSQAIHNDLNDHNILVETRLDGTAALTGILDFGDAIYAPPVCDLAITAAYLMLAQPRPIDTLGDLVAGYTAQRDLTDDALRGLWALVVTRLAVSAVNAAVMKREKPGDPYVTISEQPVWALLEQLHPTDPDLALARIRRAAGRRGLPHETGVLSFQAARRGQFRSVVGVDLAEAPIIDLSVAGRHAPASAFTPRMDEIARAATESALDGGPVIGRYAEPRLIYRAPMVAASPYPSADRRTVHLGVDIFMPAGTAVHAPLDGVVHRIGDRRGAEALGSFVVLAHETDAGDPFFTSYGHLSRATVAERRAGEQIEAGAAFATLGTPDENGGWPPHLHFQLGLHEGGTDGWPTAADPEAFADLASLYPDPCILLGLSGEATYRALDRESLLARRAARLPKNLSLSYRRPVLILRGSKQFLFDDRGRCYLDAYNNVPHVGHAHPRITDAVSRQMRLVNTNTRYLQPALIDYAEALAARLPEPLDVCFILNSGSEANELAIRLARAATGAHDVIVSRHGYHGNTGVAIDLSDYKFSRKGGAGRKDWVHVAAVPDTYRGPFRAHDPDAGARYADDVERIVATLQAQGRRVAAFISEPFPSVGGQIIPPPGYLKAVYAKTRASGGLCIADEVQTGLGRLGRFAWGFEQQRAVPDIVVLGKPIGNGYPLAAVVTTRAIADAFATGMEFFSTFGGSTLSCVVGLEVLSILDDERLADNAAVTGDHLLAGLARLATEHPCIGDVRGLGLFIGVEIVWPDGAPAGEIAGYIVNRLREQRILIGSDGPHDNVLKIRPPLCFNREDADQLLAALSAVLRETPIASAETS